MLIYSNTITCEWLYLRGHRHFTRQNGWSRSYRERAVVEWLAYSRTLGHQNSARCIQSPVSNLYEVITYPDTFPPVFYPMIQVRSQDLRLDTSQPWNY